MSLSLTYNSLHLAYPHFATLIAALLLGYGAKVDILLCVFSNCHSASVGGAIFVTKKSGVGNINEYHADAIINIYGTTFSGNSADSAGIDICNNPEDQGDVEIHATCPSPYTSITPTQGAALDILGGDITGTTNSFSACAVPCQASSDSSKDGSDGDFYCVNGGTAGGYMNACTCTSCNAGYSGTNCETADACSATTTSTDDGTDGNIYCTSGGSAGGTTGACTCTCSSGYGGAGCATTLHSISDMTTFFNLVSNEAANPDGYAEMQGNNILDAGDIAILDTGSYSCNTGENCARSDTMVYTWNLATEVKCVEDDASCILDLQGIMRGMGVGGTGPLPSTPTADTLTIRALTFDNGLGHGLLPYGGGEDGQGRGGLYFYL